MKNAQTTLLVVLDGFGLNPNPVANAVHLAKKPTFDQLVAASPNATLVTYGEAVGLPAGQMGNSEVGHLNIGAGRVIEQWLLRISRGLAGDFLNQSKSYSTFKANTAASPAIHVVGLYSSGGVHSHLEHAKLLISRLRLDYNGKICVHLITDGRDVSPNAFKADLADFLQWLQPLPNTVLASICGRFFAMDRDKRWERVEKAYRAIVTGEGADASRPLEFVESSYSSGTTDEFLEPAIVNRSPIGPDDGIVFWNFREDRMREIVGAVCVDDFTGFDRPQPPVSASRVLGCTEYDHTYHLPYLFEQLSIKNHLGDVVAAAGMKQLRVAETEKYPHVTYFMNGGIEPPCPGEERKMVPSPRDVKTYDLKPEMSAAGVTELVTTALASKEYDLIVVNLANCDMVGHTGSLEAATKAVEVADSCLGLMLQELRKVNGRAIVIADHGNAEQMMNYQDGTPHTAHTTYPVPVIVVGMPGVTRLRSDGALCDVAPTILKMMDLEQPSEMSGKSLF